MFNFDVHFESSFELKRHIDGEVRASPEARHPLDHLTIRTQQPAAIRAGAVEVGATFPTAENVLETRRHA